MIYLLEWFCRLLALPIHRRRRYIRHTRRKRNAFVATRAAVIYAAMMEHRGYPNTAQFVQACSLAAIYRRDNGRCGICHRKVELGAVGPKAAQVDHIRALAKGGAHHPSNLQLAHARCNQKKRTR